ncbi:hypothetical protein AMELA_G00030120 [Ameiurus melas]|uniref:Uncharacterized protein n=1 Tax=Ameiurus melas TaxID=219545 RepID=A0A7J6BHH3_AMEME|nr:hypothetical protein AMELA_G00030120 [Ameiurus melas]
MGVFEFMSNLIRLLCTDADICGVIAVFTVMDHIVHIGEVRGDLRRPSAGLKEVSDARFLTVTLNALTFPLELRQKLIRRTGSARLGSARRGKQVTPPYSSLSTRYGGVDGSVPPGVGRGDAVQEGFERGEAAAVVRWNSDMSSSES